MYEHKNPKVLELSIRNTYIIIIYIPKIYIKIPPIYFPNSYPRLMVDMSSAYIVPSMFDGQILQASTSIGRVFSSPTMWIRMVSAKQNGLSGNPILTFSRVTNITERNEHMK